MQLDIIIMEDEDSDETEMEWETRLGNQKKKLFLETPPSSCSGKILPLAAVLPKMKAMLGLGMGTRIEGTRFYRSLTFIDDY